MKNYQFFIALVAVLLLSGCAATETRAERATWLWDATVLKGDTDKLFTFLTEQGVSKLHVQVNNDVADHYYARFITQAQKNNIKIYALGGSPRWIDKTDNNRYEEYINWVKKYQKKYVDSAFNGVHIDVEPYLYELWEQDQKKAILLFQKFITNAQRDASSLNLPLEADIPFWFNETRYANTFGKGNLAEWLIKTVDNITIMAYRDNADDIRSIIKEEVKYAIQYKTPITIAVETVPSKEGDHISLSKKRLEPTLKDIQRTMKRNDRKVFAGFAIHDVIHWQKLIK